MKRLMKKSSANKVGFIGFSGQQFDEEKAKDIIENIFKTLNLDDIIVSGATNVGIPKLVYEKANELGMKTIGVMCSKGHEYELAKLDDLIIEGENWGDESDKFLSMLDSLYKIGGGSQSEVEFNKAKKIGIKAFQYKL